MKGQLKKNLVRSLLPLGFSSLLLVVLLCGLSRVIGAEPEVSPAVAPREKNRLGLLDYQAGVSICQQTENRVPNPGFEDGNGEPWKPEDWYECGPCTFSYGEPVPSSDVAARILGTSEITNCMLRTPTSVIDVDSDRYRFYDYSAKVKANLVEGEAYLRIRFCKWEEDNWDCKGVGYTPPVTHTNGAWITVTGSVTAPVDVEYARVEATLAGSSEGSVWFDDIFFGLATCLDICKSDDPDPVEPGQTLIYTIVYSNTGREKATDVRIIETYDYPYVVFKSAQPPPSASTNFWEISGLPPGDSGAITVVVQVADDTEERVWLSNTVQIISGETVGAISTTITTTLTAIPPTGMEINGPATGHVNTIYTFTATVSPVMTTLPITYVWEASGQPLVMNTSGLTDTVPFTWSTTGTHIIAVTAMNDWGIVADTHVVTVELCKIYLPLVYNPPIPTLHPISNTEGDGSYTVSWSAVSLASDYVLEETTDSVFTSAMEIYTVTDTSYSINGKGAARYHYRVKAHNGWGDGGWSNQQSVDVLREAEPNDNALTHANGPVVSGLTYSGTFMSPSDVQDYFYFDLDIAHSVELWLANIPVGHDYDLYLRDLSMEVLAYSDNFGNKSERIPPFILSKGRYYIQVYNRSQTGSKQFYHLRVVYK